MSPLSQILPQLQVIVNLAVEYDPDRLVFVGKRLCSGIQINNRQTRVPRQRALEAFASPVRTAMRERFHHPIDQFGIYSFLLIKLQFPANSAHNSQFFVTITQTCC
jgi:hypothetical protein